MLKNLMILILIIMAFCGSSIAATCQKAIIERDVLNTEIFSLYEKFGYVSILEDGEYADLERGEKYWLAIDSRHEYLTLRTMDNKIIEVIIRNPDLVTERGLGVGSSLKELRKAYPNAVKMTHYSNGVKRQWDTYYLPEKNIEVNFSREGIVKELNVKGNDGISEQTLVNETPNQTSEHRSKKNLQQYKNILSTYTDCKGNPALAWVVVSSEPFPRKFKGKYATIQFLVGEDSKPYNIELVEGSSEIAEWSKKSLVKGRFPSKPSSCWKVKYEYVEDASTEN